MRPKFASGCRDAVKPYTPRDHARGNPPQTAVLAPPLPDQPGATDLGERGEDEQQQRAGYEHLSDVTGASCG